MELAEVIGGRSLTGRILKAEWQRRRRARRLPVGRVVASRSLDCAVGTAVRSTPRPERDARHRRTQGEDVARHPRRSGRGAGRVAHGF
jgi:hypothetical protein